ncbi:SNF2 family helicase/ATPase-like protein [Lojkania enalia]|uniref:DNA helicase n=1 Tax=Lojkania enalia TaxID=147567 RepID=A0A9P4TRF1_9PLEO|nr:SNF2 family helicase/ATPase-like protein [Didymosphaeria enalia]
MYRKDPIVSSSPPHPQESHRAPSADSDEQLADDYNTQPTLPVHRVTQPTLPTNGTRSAYFALPSGLTQPTQLLGTPRSQIQVARSSPPSGRYSSPTMSQSQRPYNPMAPPGTYTLLPQPIARPIPIDLTSDDPLVEVDSEEEDTSRSNIKPSRFENRGRAFRVEETPQKRFLDMSSYYYDPNRKRPAAQLPEGTPPQKRSRPAPRQTGPARAMPVADMSFEDIDNPDLLHKVKRLSYLAPTKSVQFLFDTLVAKKGNYSDALEFVTRDSSDDELYLAHPHVALPSTSNQAAHEPRKTAQVNLNAPRKSIHDKFSTLSHVPTTSVVDLTTSPLRPKKKGRLMRGRRDPSPDTQEHTPEYKNSTKRESDDDEGIVISSDSEVGGSASEDGSDDNGNLLNFFNTCTIEAMVDLSSQKESDVRTLLEHRPFTSLAQVENIHVDGRSTDKKKKARKPKVTFGERLVESATTMWRGYQAVDELVKRCKDRGKPIATAMAKWGVNVFGAATDGEVAITSFSDTNDTSSLHDSGIGTPRSSHDSDMDMDTIRRGLATSSRTSLGKSRLLRKPSNMSLDLELKDYQVVGLNWLCLLYKHGISGILADDMGLGKTCQVIAFLSQLKEQNENGPHLIVVPGSTLENWLREFQRFSNGLVVEPYYGSQDSRLIQQDRILKQKSAIDVIVTTYDLAYKKDDNVFLRKCRPETCIYDEGHVLRSSNTQRYKMLMRIPARCRLLLTGTPLQNSLRELVSILNFIMPDMFGDVEDDLQAVFKHKAKVTEADTHGALLSTQRIQRARSMMTPFILRRKKAQVLQHLPKKTCRVEYCELTETQSRLYSTQLERQRQVLLDRAEGKQSNDHANVMMKLRQAAIHPLLFRDRYDDNKIRKMSKACLKEPTFNNSDPSIIYEELELYQDYQCHQLALKYPMALKRFELSDNEWMDSGKVKKLTELLKTFKENGDRTLIFSQFTSVMDILQWVLDSLDISYFRLDGTTPIAERQDMLDQFAEDKSIPVFMLSTKSGGAGINLACANKVIIFDSSFNPQDDIQAENRAHRVGQTREVEVVRLVTKGTVEEQIHALGISKLELDKMVAGEEGAASTKTKNDKLSAAEELGLEAVEDMLMEQLKKGGNVDAKYQFLNGLKKAGLDMSAA